MIIIAIFFVFIQHKDSEEEPQDKKSKLAHLFIGVSPNIIKVIEF